MSRDFTYMKFGKGDEKITFWLERKKHKSGFAGFITSSLFESDISIWIDEAWLDRNDINGGFITMADNWTKPEIIIHNYIFDGFKQGDSYSRTLMFHEIGHYVCGHLRVKTDTHEETLKRIDDLKNGIVAAEELAADKFAADHLGADMVIDGLYKAQERRFKQDLYYGCANDEISIFTNKEYSYRIASIEEAFDINCEDNPEY